MSIQKVGPRRYRVWLYLGRDANGQLLRQSETVNGTKAEAERREREVRRALDTGTFVHPTTGTVAELMARWLESIKGRESERTYERYEQMVRNQIIPDLGHVRLADLRPLHLDAAESKWATSGNRKTKRPGPLASQSVLHLHPCLHTAFDRAVKWRLLAVNPVDGVEPPHGRRVHPPAPLPAPHHGNHADRLRSSSTPRRSRTASVLDLVQPDALILDRFVDRSNERHRLDNDRHVHRASIAPER